MSRKHRPRAGLEPAAEDGPWLPPGERHPRLLLFAGEPDPALETLLAEGAVAALVAAPAALAAWRARLEPGRVALLALDDPGAEADGVHLSDPRGVGAARERLGRERIVGAACGFSRHAAMVAGEAGADYVMFGDFDHPAAPGDELCELVAWWHELFVIPCAAAGRPDATTLRALAGAGADFLALRQPAADLLEAVREVAIPAAT